MKLLDIITENVLGIYAQELQQSLNAQSHEAAEVIELKKALAKHTLIDENGQRQGAAWKGPIDGNWSPALDQAIVAWKKSINKQDPRARLELAASIRGKREIDYLLYKKKFTTGERAGELFIKPDGSLQQDQTTEKPSLKDRTYIQRLVNTDRNKVVNTKSFVDSIGWSGWFRILRELDLQKSAFGRENTDQEATQEAMRMLPLVFANLQQHPDKWRDRWVSRIVRTGTGKFATTESGKQISFDPPSVSGLSAQLASQKLYDHFSEMAIGLWAVDKSNTQQQQKQEEAPGSDVAQQMPEDQVTVWVSRMITALKNNLFAGIVPGGRGFSNDQKSVQNLMAELRSVGDWDAVEAKYNQDTGKDLGSELAAEIKNDDDYFRIVELQLERIGRIMPGLLYTNIRFAEGQDFVEVEIEGKKYRVKKGLKKNRPQIIQRPNTIVKNALVSDAALRAAITATGGTIPDPNIEVSEQDLVTAKEAFIEAIQNTYPEMVAFYTNQSPFDEFSNQIGNFLLDAKVQRASKMLANGASEAVVIDWYINDIKIDREFLIGTEDDPESAAVNIYFDPKYMNDGLRGRDGDFKTDMNDDADISVEEQDLVDRLISPDEEEQDAAIAEILETVDDRFGFRDIYIAYENSSGVTMDEELFGGVDTLKDITEGNTSQVRKSFSDLYTKYGMAFAAPYSMAKLFDDTLEGWRSDDDTEKLRILVGFIKDLRDYDNVNNYYRKIDSGNKDLLDRIDEDEAVIATKLGLRTNIADTLAGKIGKERDIQLRKSNLEPAVIDALKDLEDDPTAEKARRARDVISATVQDMDTDAAELVLESIDELRQAFGPEVDPQVKDIIKEIVDIIQEEVGEKNKEWEEKWFYQRWWSNAKGWFD